MALPLIASRIARRQCLGKGRDDSKVYVTFDIDRLKRDRTAAP